MGRCESRKGDTRLIDRIDRELGDPNINTYFMSPVKEGFISYADLINGSLTIFDIEAMMKASAYLDKRQIIIDDFCLKLKEAKDGRKTR